MQMFMTTRINKQQQENNVYEPFVPVDLHLVTAGPTSHWLHLPESGLPSPACSLIPGRTAITEWGHQAPSSAGFSHRAHQRRSQRQRRERWPLHICPQHLLVGVDSIFPDPRLRSGQPALQRPFSWLLYFLPVLQAKAGPSMALSPDTTPSPNHPLLGVDKTWPLSQTQPKASFC